MFTRPTVSAGARDSGWKAKTQSQECVNEDLSGRCHLDLAVDDPNDPPVERRRMDPVPPRVVAGPAVDLRS